MKLMLLGQFRDVELTEREAKTSKHSGKLLREVEIGFRCRNDLATQVTEELNGARKRDRALEGDDGSRWVAGLHSSSSVNSKDWRFSATLHEVEDVQAERLEFLEFALTPTYYAETEPSEGDPLVIVAEIALSGHDDEVLERHIIEHRRQNEGESTHYFDLRRVGVSDEPLQVRFGRCLWKKIHDGTRQHQLVFVAAENDVDAGGRIVGFDEPRSTNAAIIAIQGREVAQALIEEITLAQLLTPEALERIRDRGASAFDNHFRDLNETQDLPSFRL